MSEREIRERIAMHGKSLFDRGYTPIMAHPERYVYMKEDFKKYIYFLHSNRNPSLKNGLSTTNPL